MFIETRASWTDLIAGVGLQIAEVFDQGQEEYLMGIGNILNMTSGTGAQTNFTGKTGVGEVSNFVDGDNIPGGNRFKTYTTTVAYNNYGKALQVTKNTIEDRDFAGDLDEMKDLSVAANYSQDRSGSQLFNGGFATTTLVNGYTMTFYGDGKPTFSTIHPTVVPGASTQSNASSTGIVFGHDNLETASIALRLQKTDDGIPLSMNGKTMLVGAPAIEREMNEEINSMLDPETSNNAINVYKGSSDVAISHFFATTNGGSDSAWFLVVPGRHKMYHETRQAPTLESDVNILNKTVTYTVDARWANYVKEWKRTWGSKGDLTAYSS
jgi:hypothetical protein